MPEPQKKLFNALGDGWIAEYAVSLGGRIPGYPTNYKLDIAKPDIKLGIEVDGFSHVALERRAQDRKKDAMLNSLGWIVLRFTNKQIMSSIDIVMSQISLYYTI